MALTKHRDERLTMVIDYSKRLLQGETISVLSNAFVLDKNNVDVTIQFGFVSTAIVNQTIEIEIERALQSIDQLRGRYILFVRIETSLNRFLVETPTLVVSDEGSVT